MFLLLQTGMLGVFMSLDFFLFYVFWELVLVPMYFIIGVWGGPRKLYAAIKFFLYTLAGSVLMLLGILTLYFQHYSQFHVYSFEIADLMKRQPAAGARSSWVFWAFFIGFAIKVPMFPFHTWLPDAHVEAPTAGSVILAAVLLKMGTYGFLRFSLPLLPQASVDQKIVQILAVLSIIGIIYGALVSLMQEDWKKLIAYSSVSHLGFCTLGIFSLNPNGIAGSVLQQINHGISTGMLFMVIGVIYERRHTREISEYGGLAHVMPKFAIIFAIRHAELGGAAAAQRLRRRVHDPAGRVRSEPDLGGLRGHRRDSRRGVPAVALPADHAGPGDQRQEPDDPGHELARDRDVRAADRVGDLDRDLSQAVLRHSAAAGGGDRGARAARIFRQAPCRTRDGAGTPAGRSAGRRRDELQPVLHDHRSLHDHPGGDAGAVRVRHPAVRLS